MVNIRKFNEEMPVKKTLGYKELSKEDANKLFMVYNC